MQTWSPSCSRRVLRAFRAFARTSISFERAQSRSFHSGRWLFRHAIQKRTVEGNPRDDPGRYLRAPVLNRGAVQQELKKVKRELQHPPKDASTKLLQCLELDPYLRHWEAFTKVVDTAVKDQGPSDLRATLQRATQKSGREGMFIHLQAKYVEYLASRKISKEESRFQQKIADLRYPTEWFPVTRMLQRQIHLHVGPTNSGKTYQALKRLEESKTGFYAGPLRLLAHEVYSTFRARGLNCGLVTGDEVRGMDGQAEPPITCHTVEMVPLGKDVDVAVIDEIQMIGDKHRGWAWTNALLGARAKEVHVCGEVRTAPLIRELAASMGDTLHVHDYERLNPLKAMTTSLKGSLKHLRKGDCLVCFTIIGLHAMKREIEVTTGRRCAIVYGSLPPEVRAQQAELFNDPDNDFDFLVASDAVGMGLNLRIKRIIFESTWKNDGSQITQLSTSALKQIAGRAGRFRVAPKIGNEVQEKQGSPLDNEGAIGLVTSLSERDLPFVQDALGIEPEPLRQAGILPPSAIVERFAAHCGKNVPFSYVMRRLHHIALVHPRFFLCDIEHQCLIADAVHRVKSLTPWDRHTLTSSPANVRFGFEKSGRVVSALARCIAEQKGDLLDIPEIELEVLDLPVSGNRDYLQKLEDLHKALILYTWLSYRFTGVFTTRPMAFYAKSLVEEKIDQALLEFSANAKLRKQLLVEKQRKIEKGVAKEAAMKDAEERKWEEQAAEQFESREDHDTSEPNSNSITASPDAPVDPLPPEFEDDGTIRSLSEEGISNDEHDSSANEEAGPTEELLGADIETSSQKVAKILRHVLSPRPFHLFWRKRKRSLDDVEVLLSYNQWQLGQYKGREDKIIFDKKLFDKRFISRTFHEPKTWMQMVHLHVGLQLGLISSIWNNTPTSLGLLRATIRRRRSKYARNKKHSERMDQSVPSQVIGETHALENPGSRPTHKIDHSSRSDMSKARFPESLRASSTEYSFFL